MDQLTFIFHPFNSLRDYKIVVLRNNHLYKTMIVLQNHLPYFKVNQKNPTDIFFMKDL